MAENGKRRRVVVTGLGAVTPEGVGLDAYWAGVRGGVVAIKKVEHLPMEGYRTQLGGEVREDFAPSHDYLTPDGFHDRAIDFTMRAAEEAMSRCGVGVGPVPAERWGVVIGTCNAGLLAGEEWYARNKRGEQPDPRLLLLVEPQAFSEALAGAFGLKGPVLSVDTACAARGPNSTSAPAKAAAHPSRQRRDRPARPRRRSFIPPPPPAAPARGPAAPGRSLRSGCADRSTAA